jgi:hypothetical protein
MTLSVVMSYQRGSKKKLDSQSWFTSRVSEALSKGRYSCSRDIDMVDEVFPQQVLWEYMIGHCQNAISNLDWCRALIGTT